MNRWQKALFALLKLWKTLHRWLWPLNDLSTGLQTNRMDGIICICMYIRIKGSGTYPCTLLRKRSSTVEKQQEKHKCISKDGAFCCGYSGDRLGRFFRDILIAAIPQWQITSRSFSSYMHYRRMLQLEKGWWGKSKSYLILPRFIAIIPTYDMRSSSTQMFWNQLHQSSIHQHPFESQNGTKSNSFCLKKNNTYGFLRFFAYLFKTKW